MNETLCAIKAYNFWDGPLNEGFIRQSYLDKINIYDSSRLVKVLVGQRRSGKSYILRQIAGRLISGGTSPRNTFFVNMDILAFDFIHDYKDLERLFRLYLREFQPKGRIYIFIDEVQNISQWERFVNSYSQDISGDYAIYLTGSNSKMLSGELASMLSGRYVTINVYPLSYREYCDAGYREYGRASYMQYLHESGMPEMLHLSDEEARANYVSALKDTILLRDIIQRYNIKDPRLLDDLFTYLVNNTSTLFSVNSLIKYFKGMGRKVSYDKVALYLSYMSDAYLIHRADRYNVRGKEQLAGLCKYYANDLCFSNYLFRGNQHGIGYDLENAVYLQLRRMGYDVYVGDNGGLEVDFVARRRDRIVYLQVAYMLVDDKTISREYASLESISDNYEKYVVSLDDYPLASRGGIINLPAWQLEDKLG